MTSTPAWSMGTSKRSNVYKGTNAPGPGNYNPPSRNKQASPGWRMGTATRNTEYKSDTPGPGSYNSPGKLSKSPPHYGIAGRYAQICQSITPGPGTYDHNAFKSVEPLHSYSFGIKTPVLDNKTKVPGPGAYDQTSKILNITSPGYRLGSAKRDGLYTSPATPGPGMYATRPSSSYNRDSGPKYGFGTANRDELQAMSKTLPGPGTYDLKGTFAEIDKGISLAPRRPDSALISSGKAPGPGAYTPNLITKKSSPAFRMGSASRDTKERVGSPGPGNYDPISVQKNKNVIIGTSKRASLPVNGYTPGPGSYDCPLRVGEGPKYVMNPRRDDSNLLSPKYIPGPGAYNPSVDLIKGNNSGAKIGTSNRTELYDSKANPGPGQYDVRGRITGPKWGFGSDQRGKDYKSTVPGPGSYDLPSNVGAVPKYAYGNGPLKIHL